MGQRCHSSLLRGAFVLAALGRRWRAVQRDLRKEGAGPCLPEDFLCCCLRHSGAQI